MAYVGPDHVDGAVQAALAIFAKVTCAREANLDLRRADPWLVEDDAQPPFVERGQRLLDYEEDPMIPLARRLTLPG